jgi:hypothetical protein
MNIAECTGLTFALVLLREPAWLAAAPQILEPQARDRCTAGARAQRLGGDRGR